MDKSKMYIVNGREGQYELTTDTGKDCFFMSDTLEYEYFKDAKIKEKT